MGQDMRISVDSPPLHQHFVLEDSGAILRGQHLTKTKNKRVAKHANKMEIKISK